MTKLNQGDIIRFKCHSCGVELSVPVHLAGVSGPCPSCGEVISAPQLHAVPLTQQGFTPIPMEEHEFITENKKLHDSGLAWENLKLQSLPTEGAPLPDIDQTQLTILPQQPDQPAEDSLSKEIKIEQGAEQQAASKVKTKPKPPKHDEQSKPLHLILVPVVFLSVIGAFAFGYQFFRTKKDADSSKPKVVEYTEEERKPSPANGSGESPNRTKPIEPDQASSELDPNISLPPVANDSADTPKLNKDDGTIALELLQGFLRMNNLEERMPFMETSLSEEELRTTILKEKLPEVATISVNVIHRNTVEQLTDFFYHVDFVSDAEKTLPILMLVRKRGSQAPKVVVDSFIDLYGGKLAKFAEAPSPLSQSFQVMINVGAYCNDEDVPNRDKKYTIKILSREDSEPLISAYFDIDSNVGKMLADQNSGITYGEARPCKILLRWNTVEDEQLPYIEAVEITALSWNP